MALEEKQILDLLLSQQYVSSADLARVEKLSKQGAGTPLDLLLSGGFLSKDLLGQALAEFYKVPYADLNTKMPSREQILLIPEGVAKQFRAVLFTDAPKKFVIATDLPQTSGLSTAVKESAKGRTVSVVYALSEDIDRALQTYWKPLETELSEILSNTKRAAPELVEEILHQAIGLRASDIHFEPQEKEVVIRFRIDGVMQRVASLKRETYENVLNRLKVMSHLRTDQHDKALDGSIRYRYEGDAVDIRVSIVPIFDGEKVVLRLLSSYTRGLSLESLGLSSPDQEKLITASNKPFGMILVAGPTGSGKTTTLYGVMKILNTVEVNIATIEDPVEYKIPNVNHMQVNSETGLTFARGLRSIVRQDPDIILVGEIRDEETADIATNAALTGHLLLSTFHANDAATAIPRLLDMGVEPFLLASTLELVIAQRLVRKICDQCRYSLIKTEKQIKKEAPDLYYFSPKKSYTLYAGKGCHACAGTGFSGRTAILEIIEISSALQSLIMTRPSTQDIWKLARAEGATSMFEDGLQKVLQGLTTLEELHRIASPSREDLVAMQKRGFV
ncbi:MAG: GspE/PulE family protein [Patescibacteria group bacterium]|jgi:type IV pilus assembly protein PilB